MGFVSITFSNVFLMVIQCCESMCHGMSSFPSCLSFPRSHSLTLPRLV